jgi:hypothetical protein
MSVRRTNDKEFKNTTRKSVKDPASEIKQEVEDVPPDEDGKSSTVVFPLPLKASPGSSMSGLPASLSKGDSQKPVKFRMTASGNLQSSAIGVLSGSIACNPTVTSFTELATLQALYAEIKLVRASLTVANYNPDFDSAVGGVESGPLPIAWVADNQSTPTSLAAVWGVANCKIFGLSSKRPMTISGNVTNRSYVSNTAGSYAPGPYAGMAGSFIYYQSGLSNSNTYVGWFLEVEVLVRQRI